MHPLTTFPGLLTFQLLAPFIIRVTAGLYVLWLGKNQLKKPMAWLSIFYFLPGIFVIVGLYTQIAALVAICVVKLDFWNRIWLKRHVTKPSPQEMWLYIIIALTLFTLLFTGPGLFAFDLPL